VQCAGDDGDVLNANMIGTGLSSGPSMTAIFTPGSDGRSFHVSSEGSSMM
jgi:hypothetical protein